MELDVIIVSIIFIVFCIGGYLLVKKAEQELTGHITKDKKNGVK